MSPEGIAVRTADGLHLAGTLDLPESVPNRALVMVHGGGVTREEGGFFTRLAAGLSAAGIASLRFDLRGHGESEGRQEELTLSGILTDIRAALATLQEHVPAAGLALLGASFSGGICAYYASLNRDQVTSLVLLNPLVNYKKRFIDDKPYWSDDQIDEQSGRELLANGYIPHSPTFKLSRPLLNEVFYLQPHLAISLVASPTLIIHGTKDTFIPVESSRRIIRELPEDSRLIELHGAQHGIAVDNDPGYADPQTQKWQAEAISTVADWVSTH